MIVDSSAVIAILNSEPEAEEFARLMVPAHTRMSVANWLEATMVAEHKKTANAADRLDQLVAGLGIELEPVTVKQDRMARAAFRRYGRGSGSPARLNFGDCFAYALSSTAGEPLLFKGDDFVHTDVAQVR